MTETQWLSSDDPAMMLEEFNFTKDSIQGRLNPPSDRKLRLLTTAWWWRKYHGKTTAGHFYDKRLWLEGWIDRGAPRAEIEALPHHRSEYDTGFVQGCYLLRESAVKAARDYLDELHDAEQAALLRDIAGNPFRSLPVWRNEGQQGLGPINDYRVNWITTDVLSLAETVYMERKADGTLDPAGLLVLSDALEEAGCPVLPCTVCNRTGFSWGSEGRCAVCKGAASLPHPILVHLRSPGPHIRGCWTLDLLLGKD